MRYQFSHFVLDTDRFELSGNGKLLPVEPQVVELLALLIENRDRMVTKEEINESVWRGRVVSEAALSGRIKTARKVLGDNGRDQQVIRTIHKKGFRFVAPLTAEPNAPPSEEVQSRRPINQTHTKPAIAVLPFANLSNDEEQEYLSDGITTDIITYLSKHKWLNVTARNTSFGFKGVEADNQSLGKELGVDYLVEGTVQRAGNRIRVSAHLVDATTGHQKWSDRYDRELSDIFSLQDELTGMIVSRLEPEIGTAERNKIILARPANLQAWDSYHLGIYHFFKFTAADNLEAQRLLLQSQQQDNNFGEPYAWWAYAAILGMVYWDVEPTPEILDRALGACDKALSLDSQNALFYALKARVLLARKEYQLAIAENKIAIDMNPTLAAAHCGLGDSLAYEGRYDEALVCFDKAIALSSNDPQLWAFYTYGALTLIFKNEFATAIQWAERAGSIPNCQYWSAAHKVVALAYLDREHELEIAKQKLMIENPDFTCAFAREKLFYLRKKEQIELYINGLQKAGIREA
jgi:adenylate cyclase